jgi:hypothetical protein
MLSLLNDIYTVIHPLLHVEIELYKLYCNLHFCSVKVTFRHDTDNVRLFMRRCLIHLLHKQEIAYEVVSSLLNNV